MLPSSSRLKVDGADMADICEWLAQDFNAGVVRWVQNVDDAETELSREVAITALERFWDRYVSRFSCLL